MIKEQKCVDEDGEPFIEYSVDDDCFEEILRQLWKTQSNDDYEKVAQWLNGNIENIFEGIKVVRCVRTEVTLMASQFKIHLNKKGN